MGKQFFSSWALWQQMTFVLACGIVATVLLGLCKLRYDTYRMRKYVKVEKGKQVQTPEMLEAQLEIKDDIPFGIRAIESGIEVDGVWISGSNTPVDSSRSSMADIRALRSNNNSQPELPQTVHGSSSNSSRAPSAFDVAVSAERIHTNESRSSSPGRGNSAGSRGRPPASMTTRYSYNDINRNSTTLNALEGVSPTSSSGRREPFSDQQAVSSSSSGITSSGKSSRRTSDESDYHVLQDARPYEAAYINPRYKSLVINPIDPRTDLDLLQSHRMSHVAETGQLTPRVRKPGNSGEWASVADMRLPQEIATANGVNYFVPQQKTPSPPPPTMDPSQDKSAHASKPTQDGHASNQAKQAIPLLETYAPRRYYLPEAYQPKGPHYQYSYDEMPIEVETTQNQRGNSQVLRKVNSGFEILRPGTLAPPTPEELEKVAQTEKRQSKRLQKKRRTSSAGSRTSNFTEQA